MSRLLKYLARVCIAFSIFLNVLFGGDSNQTFSATQWERRRLNKPNLVFIIDFIFYKEQNHCLEAWVKWQLIHYAIKNYESYGTKYMINYYGS